MSTETISPADLREMNFRNLVYFFKNELMAILINPMHSSTLTTQNRKKLRQYAILIGKGKNLWLSDKAMNFLRYLLPDKKFWTLDKSRLIRLERENAVLRNKFDDLSYKFHKLEGNLTRLKEKISQ